MQRDNKRALVQARQPGIDPSQRDQLDVDYELGEGAENRRRKVLIEREGGKS